MRQQIFSHSNQGGTFLQKDSFIDFDPSKSKNPMLSEQQRN